MDNSEKSVSKLLKSYSLIFGLLLAAGVAVVGYTYCRLIHRGDIVGQRAVIIAGYSIIAAGVILCLLLALMRLHALLIGNNRFPGFAAGVAVLAIGAGVIVAGSLFP